MRRAIRTASFTSKLPASSSRPRAKMRRSRTMVVARRAPSRASLNPSLRARAELPGAAVLCCLAIRVQDPEGDRIDGEDGVVSGVDRAAVALLGLAQLAQRRSQIAAHAIEGQRQVTQLAGRAGRQRPIEVSL